MTSSTLAEYERDLVALESTIKQAHDKVIRFHNLNREMAEIQAEALQLESAAKRELSMILTELQRHHQDLNKDDPHSTTTAYVF